MSNTILAKKFLELRPNGTVGECATYIKTQRKQDV